MKDKAVNEHILVCLSPSPSNERIIKAAADMARMYGAAFTALYIKTPLNSAIPSEDLERLERNINLAKNEGATVSTVWGDDVADSIAEFALISGVTRLIIGKTNARGGRVAKLPTISDKLVKALPELEMHIIPDHDGPSHYLIDNILSRIKAPTFKSLILTGLILLISSAFGMIFEKLSFTDAHIITVYLLGALVCAFLTKNYISSLIFSIVSVLLFTFFFAEPRLSLRAYESGYPVTFVIMLFSSIAVATLTNNLRASEEQSAHTAYKTKILLDTETLLFSADTREMIIDVLSLQLTKLWSRSLVVYKSNGSELSQPLEFPAEKGGNCKSLLSNNEISAAKMSVSTKSLTGSRCENMSDCLGLYLPVIGRECVHFVVGVEIGKKPLDPTELSIGASIVSRCANAYDGILERKEREKATVVAKNEQLRSSLLRSISHDIRTPLTAIYGNAQALLMNDSELDEKTKSEILTDICDESLYLTKMVENLLNVTKIEEGRMKLKLTISLIDEVLTDVVERMRRQIRGREITLDMDCELMLTRIDQGLISQVLLNLIDNADKYSPKGEPIEVSAVLEGDFIRISVADHGYGIPEPDKEKVFELFYTGSLFSDSRRSLGLGLSLARSIIIAHGGGITVLDNEPTGSIFTFTLPKSEVNINGEALDNDS